MLKKEEKPNSNYNIVANEREPNDPLPADFVPD
jgi:hypothetical protein